MGSQAISYVQYQEAADFIAKELKRKSRIGIVCGSGLSTLTDKVEDAKTIPYEDIPHFPTNTVVGHSGQMVLGTIAKVPVICLQGRFHYYEGYTMQQCTMYVRVLKLLGVQYLILTNAAGGINDSFKVGDVMLIKDHINLMGFSGSNPLMGPNDDRWGPRFPAVNTCYDKELVSKSKEILHEMHFEGNVHEGVYCAVSGPNYESTGENIMLKSFGVDAVGMSTVPEVIVAKHCDINVVALSLITNESCTDYNNVKIPSHEEVVAVANQRTEALKIYVENLVDFIGTVKTNTAGKCACKEKCYFFKN